MNCNECKHRREKGHCSWSDVCPHRMKRILRYILKRSLNETL